MKIGEPYVPVTDFFALQTGVVGTARRQLSVVPLGDLVIPSGNLLATDPFAGMPHGPTVQVQPGRHPVLVTKADVSTDQDGSHLREAYLSVVLAEGTAVEVRDLLNAHDKPAGVGVDAGTVAFVDRTALDTAMPPESDWYELFESSSPTCWFRIMDDPAHIGSGLANIAMPLATAGENVVLAHSGWGDGSYPLVATLDANERVLAVHIDLLVVTVLPEAGAK